MKTQYITFIGYNDAMCYGAGGTGFTPVEAACLQSYWDTMVANWVPEVATAFGHLVDTACADQEKAFFSTGKVLHPAIIFCLACAPSYTPDAWHTHTLGYVAEVEAYANAALRFSALYYAAWSAV